MSDHPPGYEAERPVDLSKPVSMEPATVGEPVKPARPSPETPDERPLGADDGGVPMQQQPVRGLVAVANIQPRTFKSTVARMLYAGLETRHSGVRLWNGVGTPTLDGLVVADMPADPHGGDWRRQSWGTDLLVLPVPDDQQAARAAWWMLDQLEAAGRPDLVISAIVVAIRTGARPRLARAIVRNFTDRTAGVIRVKLPKGIARADDHTRWEPLVSTVSLALSGPAAPNRPTPLRPIDSGRIVQFDSRRHGKAASQ